MSCTRKTPGGETTYIAKITFFGLTVTGHRRVEYTDGTMMFAQATVSTRDADALDAFFATEAADDLEADLAEQID